MSRLLFLSAAICLSFAASTSAIDPATVGLSSDKLAAVTELLECQVEVGNISGAVALVARHGRVAYLQAVGKSDNESGSEMSTDAVFRIASMTKVITSAAILSLVEDGRISLTDPLSKYLPAFGNPRLFALASSADPKSTNSAQPPCPTIHHLLTHTSGLTYGWFGPEQLDEIYRAQNIPDLFVTIDETIGERVERIAAVPLKFQPGTAWDYGVSLDVLGRVVEVVSGLTLEQFFYERFIRPLKMVDTHFYVPDDKLRRLATLYTVDDNKTLVPVTDPPVTAGFLKFSGDYCHAGKRQFFSGGGGLVSTATDYARFLQMLLNGGELDGVRVLRRDTVALMTRSQIGDLTIPFGGHGDGFGYGFGVLTNRGYADDVASVATYSWGGVFNTYFWVDPQEQLIGVLMTQLFPYDHLDLRAEFKRLAYDAIDDTGFARVYWYEKGLEHANPHFNSRQLRVNAPAASIHPQFASRSEPRSSGMARIAIDEDLRSIRRAELYCELWGGHPGTANKRVSVNGRSEYYFPEVGTAQQQCTHQYHTFNLKITDLVNGYNSLQFNCDQGDAFWGHYIVDNAAIHVGLETDDPQLQKAELTDFDVKIKAARLSDGEGYRLHLEGDSASLAAISRVAYQARFLGYNENGDRQTIDWHGMTKGRRPYGIVGSSTDQPFAVTWATRMLPHQKNVAVRATIEFKHANNIVYRTHTLGGLEIPQRPDSQVAILHAAELPTPFWSRAGRAVSCTIPMDIRPTDIESAELHVVAWTGGGGTVKEYFTLNGHHFPIAEGNDHEIVYSRLPVDPSQLKQGANQIELLSDTEHHGIEIMAPGPALLVRYRSPSSPEGKNTLIRDAVDASTPNHDALWQHALVNRGDVEKGRQLFRDEQNLKCSVCHKIGKVGGEVGPDLSMIGGKFDRPHLIESILQPSAQIVAGYRTSMIETIEGRVVTGVIKEQSDQEVTIVDVNNHRTTIPTSQIEEKADVNTSLMPTGQADLLEPQQFTDLIAYLESLRPGRAKFGSGVIGPVTLPDGFAIETVATGLTGATALETTRDGRILVCEQTGRLRVIKGGRLLEEPFLEIEVDSTWERGLIGVTVDPDFPATPHVFVCYVAKDPYPHHRVSRFTARGDAAVPGSEKILLSGDDQRRLGGNVPAGHQGGALHFGPDGKLYIGIGEQTAETPAQKLGTFQGKILRINSDGTIPADNPFYGKAQGKYRAIWAVGCRNPFTFAFQETTGDMLINDVGGEFEEINRGRAGANFGWPRVDHGPADDARFEDPLHIYPEASISGGDFATDDSAWPENFRGRYFFADFVHGWIKSLDPAEPAEAATFATGLRRPVDMRFADDGSLYILLRNAWVIDYKFQAATGSLLRIYYAN